MRLYPGLNSCKTCSHELVQGSRESERLRRPRRTVVKRTVHDPEMRPDRISSDIPALPIRTLPAIQVQNDWTLHNIIVAADGVDYIVDFKFDARSELRWLDGLARSTGATRGSRR